MSATSRSRRERTTIQFDFTPPHRFRAWLVFDPSDATVCTQDPGYEVDIWIRADAMELERVWMGRTSLHDAVAAGTITIDGLPRGLRTFERWFAWSPYRDTVIAAAEQRGRPSAGRLAAATQQVECDGGGVADVERVDAGRSGMRTRRSAGGQRGAREARALGAEQEGDGGPAVQRRGAPRWARRPAPA